jgi:hypothetical protein
MKPILDKTNLELNIQEQILASISTEAEAEAKILIALDTGLGHMAWWIKSTIRGSGMKLAIYHKDSIVIPEILLDLSDKLPKQHPYPVLRHFHRSQHWLSLISEALLLNTLETNP